MNVNEIISGLRERLTMVKERLPLYFSAPTAVSLVLEILMLFVAVLTGNYYNFFFKIWRIVYVISAIALVLRGGYTLVLFKKSFILPLAAGGVFDILNGLMIIVRGDGSTIWNVIYFLSMLALNYYLFAQADGGRVLGLAGLASAAAWLVLELLRNAVAGRIYYVAGGRLFFLLMLLPAAAAFIAYITGTAALCTASDYAGGAGDVIAPIVSKVAGSIPSLKQGTDNAVTPGTADVKKDAPGAVSGAAAAAAAAAVNTVRSVPASAEVKLDPAAIAAASENGAVNPAEVAEAVAQFSSAETTAAPGKVQYKTVAGPVGLTVGKKDSYEAGVKSYAAIIDREAVGGWKLDSIYEIPVTKTSGCLGALMGRGDETVYFNMLIFYKED